MLVSVHGLKNEVYSCVARRLRDCGSSFSSKIFGGPGILQSSPHNYLTTWTGEIGCMWLSTVLRCCGTFKFILCIFIFRIQRWSQLQRNMVLSCYCNFNQKWLILNIKNMSFQSNADITYKVLLIGESAVGKTSLIRSYSKPDESFTPSLLPTYGE